MDRLTRVFSGLALLLMSLTACTGGGAPTVTSDQAIRVELGNSKEEVSAFLGGPGQAGSFTEEGGPRSGQEWNDCWFYSKTGGHRLIVCFVRDDAALLVGSWHRL